MLCHLPSIPPGGGPHLAACWLPSPSWLADLIPTCLLQHPTPTLAGCLDLTLSWTSHCHAWPLCLPTCVSLPNLNAPHTHPTPFPVCLNSSHTHTKARQSILHAMDLPPLLGVYHNISATISLSATRTLHARSAGTFFPTAVTLLHYAWNTLLMPGLLSILCSCHYISLYLRIFFRRLPHHLTILTPTWAVDGSYSAFILHISRVPHCALACSMLPVPPHGFHLPPASCSALRRSVCLPWLWLRHHLLQRGCTSSMPEDCGQNTPSLPPYSLWWECSSLSYHYQEKKKTKMPPL